MIHHAYFTALRSNNGYTRINSKSSKTGSNVLECAHNTTQTKLSAAGMQFNLNLNLNYLVQIVCWNQGGLISISISIHPGWNKPFTNKVLYNILP